MDRTQKTVLIGVLILATVLMGALGILASPAIARFAMMVFFGFIGLALLLAAMTIYAKYRLPIEAAFRNYRQRAADRREHRRSVREERQRRRNDTIAEEPIRESILFKMDQEPWRDYRGIQFEDFVSRIFRAHDIKSEKTNGSSDQGIDLVVTGNQARLAIQVKGWRGNVGNSAVQEVVAGMRVYQCNYVAVVTNSQFTSAAIDLARTNHVWMISCDEMNQLIYGKHPIFQIFQAEKSD